MNNKQSGLTLIELMISLVLSLALIASISSLFVQMQKSNKVQRGVSGMADESSYVQEVLQKEIRSTGRLRSRTDTDGTNDRVFLDAPDSNNVLASGLNLGNSEYIKGNTDANANDQLLIRYQLLDEFDLRAGTVSNGSSPCTQDILTLPSDLIASGPPDTLAGDPATEVHVVTVRIWLTGTTLTCQAQRQKIDILKAVAQQSQCLKNCNAPGSYGDFTPNAGLNPIQIISNVVKLQLRYGVDTNNDTAADYYVNAASVPLANWANVVSVRMTVVVRSDDKFIRDAAVAYSIDGTNYTPADDQHQLYKVFTTTIALRNQLM